jgi:hypothetical protein
MSTLATDDFNRADGGLGANWTDMSIGFTGIVIVSNTAQDNAGADSGSFYSGVSFPNDQWGQCVRTGGDGGGIMLRGSAPRTWYVVSIEGTLGASASLLFAKFIAGVFTQIGTTQTVTFNSGDTLYGEVQGTTLLAKRNGSALGTSETDSAIASGSPGLFGFGAFIADDFAAGDFGGAAAYNPIPAIDYYYRMIGAKS